MTNGSGHHDGAGGQKKPAAKKSKAEELRAKLKRKNLLPKAALGDKK
jgi:hypothetical protein